MLIFLAAVAACNGNQSTSLEAASKNYFAFSATFFWRFRLQLAKNVGQRIRRKKNAARVFLKYFLHLNPALKSSVLPVLLSMN